MATLMEPYVLSESDILQNSIGATSCVLQMGLQKQHQVQMEGVAITTKSGIHCFHLLDHKCVKSWLVKPSFRLNPPAFQLPNSNIFVGFEESKHLFSWSADQQELPINKKLSLASKIHEAHPLPSVAIDLIDPAAMIVVTHVDGKISLVNCIESKIASVFSPANKNLALKHSNIMNINGNIVLITASVDKQSPGTNVIDIFQLQLQSNMETSSAQISPEFKHTGHTTISVPDTKTNALCVSSSPEGDIFILWSNARLTKYCFASQLKEILVSSETQFSIDIIQQSDFDIFLLSNNLLNSKDNNTVNMTYLTDGYVAIVYMESNGSLSTSVWETSFGSLQSKKGWAPETTQIYSTLKVFDHKSQAMGDRLVACSDHGVLIIPYYLKPFSLLETIGKMKQSTTNSSTFKPPLSTIVPIAQDDDKLPSMEEWEKKVNVANELELSVIGKLDDDHTIAAADAFEETFFQYVDSLKKDSDNTDEVLLSQNFMNVVIGRCIRETRFSTDKVLSYLLKTQSISSVALPLLIPYLMRKRLLSLLESTLLRIRDIREVELIALLRYFLSDCPENILESFQFGQTDSATTPLLYQAFHPRERFLHLVVSCPRNEYFLLQCLKSLTQSEVVVRRLI